MMKRLITASLLGFVAATAFAQSGNNYRLNFSGELQSMYVWRGINIVDGSVFQPALYFEHDSGLSVMVWGNMDLTDANGLEGEITETRIGVRYMFQTAHADMWVGYLRYTYPNTAMADTAEVVASITFKTAGNPTITAFQDVDVVEGFYIMGSFSTSLANVFAFSGQSQPLDVRLWVGFANEAHNFFYYGSATSGITDAGVRLSTGIPIGGNFTLTPSVTYATLASDDLLAGAPNRQNVYIGVSIGLEF
ncbi:MAG: hypothetical protein IH944_00640 [Armatimonadetes bacterium]|nr:hypothetical protein [Armatimonadota bacterium]